MPLTKPTLEHTTFLYTTFKIIFRFNTKVDFIPWLKRYSLNILNSTFNISVTIVDYWKHKPDTGGIKTGKALEAEVALSKLKCL